MPSGAPPSVRGISARRFKRALLGYRARDVDEALAARDAALEVVGESLAEANARIAAKDIELRTRGSELFEREQAIDDLERVATRLAERVVERERELRRARAELARLREREDDGVGSLIAIAKELEEVRRQARGQATRMRLAALRQAAKIAASGGRGSGEREVAEPAAAPPAATEASSNGHRVTAAEGLFQGLVEVEIGPLSDFGKLVGFEDAANAIGAASEISVRRFSGGRATLQMHLREPVELLRELEERAPFDFRVRDQRDGRITLDVDE